MSKKIPSPKMKSGSSKKKSRLFENLLKVTLESFKGKNYSPRTKEAIVQRLQIHPEHLDIFDSVLAKLISDNEITVQNGLYTLPAPLKSTEKLLQGQLSVHPRGFGFVSFPSPMEDVFIPKPFINGAIDGDIVEVVVDSAIESVKGPEGKITKIIQRERTRFAGTIISSDSHSAALYSSLFASSLDSIPSPHLFDKKQVQVGDRFCFEVLEWDKGNPKKIKLVEFLGTVQEAESDIPFVIAENNLPSSFSKAIEEEALAFGTKVTTKDMKDRLDLKELECVTIDPDTAKDFDDAVSIEQIGSTYRLGVHIADVSHYVKPETLIDLEASKRCNSTYFPGKCIPMLPRELSENLCSLKPDTNRLAVSVFMDINHEGVLLSWNIVRSVIRSKKRFTYKEAKAILDGTKKSQYLPLLERMVALCTLLKKQRTLRGSVQLYMPEIVIQVDQKGNPTGTEKIEYDITHQMIEEFMLKANEVVAYHLMKEGKDVTYRVHEEPAAESLRDFSSLVRSFGYSLPELPDTYDIQKLFLEIEGSEHAQYLSTCYIKSMRLACYSADNIGHYGLSLEHYCHFTSPIRRYVDTIVHRLLFEKALPRETIQALSQKASEQERISARAESTVLLFKKLRLLEILTKNDKKRPFTAIVTRIKPFGIYFDIVELMLEGFIHISDLEDDYFIFNENSNVLHGRYKGYDWKSGDELSVRCESLDLLHLEARWKFLEKISDRPVGELEPANIHVKTSKKSKKHGTKGKRKQSRSRQR